MKRQWIVLSLSLTLPFLVACSLDALAGGSGSTTTNGMVVGKMVTAAGAGASRTLVGLFRSDYDPVKDTADVPKDTTDSAGNFSFPHVPPDDYSVLAVHLDNMTRAIVVGLHVAEDTVTAPVGALQAPGKMNVSLPEGINSVTGYIYIPGTSCFEFLNDRTDSVELDSLPPGCLPEVSYSSTNGSASTVIRYDVPIAPGGTSVVVNPSWKYSKTALLNTTPTGADVAGRVEHFPVLIRLTPSNFDFSQAQANGADIRFTKSDNTFLPHEVERWDPVTGLAEVWVNVDTLYGNDGYQSLMMYWGNTAASSGSNGSSVFDTGRGFLSVWHLGDTPVGNASIKDQTANGHHGTPLGEFSAADLVDGLIGKGLNFRGMNSTIYIGKGVKTGPAFTLETWVFSTIYEPQRFMCDQNGYSLWYDEVKKGFRLEYRDKYAWRGIPQDGGTVQPMTTGEWYYLAGTFDGDRVRLYINGTLATASDSIGSAPRASTDSLLIGSAWHLEHVQGVMDEVRIESLPRSDDWIKLCYMNQKEQDALVKW